MILEPVLGSLRQCLIEAAGYLLAGQSVRLQRRFHGDTADTSCEQMERAADGGNRFILSGDVAGRAFAYSKYFSPKPRLIIFGAGNDARYLAQLVDGIGFEVVVADWRSGLCTQDRFPRVTLKIGEPEQLIQTLSPSDNDYVVVMSHQMERDRRLLALLAKLPVRYVGIMGSSVRINRLLQNLRIPARFHFPVGLPIGALGAEEIAVSIAAELIRVRRMEGAGVRNGGEFG